MVSLEDLEAGQVDAEGLVGAVEGVSLKMVEDLLDVFQGLSWLSPSQVQAGQASQGLRWWITEARLVVVVQGLLVGGRGAGPIPQAGQGVAKGQGRIPLA
jgi:hypothetical protein